MASITIQPSSIDTYLYEGDANTNFGNLALVIVGDNGSTKDTRSAIEFDISSIPAGATIITAQLDMYLYSEGGGAACSVDLHRVTADWAEHTATWNNQPAYDATVHANTSIDAVGWYSWTGLATLVQNWFDGTWDNHGVLAKQHTESAGNVNYKRLYSSEYTTDTTKRPKLTVEYTIPTPSFTADAILKGTQANSFTADARLYQPSFTADAVLQETQTGSFTADAYLVETFTADAVLKETQSSSITADAVLKETQSSSFTADGILLKTTSDTLTADAVLLKTQTDTFTADACLTSDAVSPKQHLFAQAGPVYLPVFPIQPVSVSVTTDHTADYRSVIFCDATSGSLTVTLPATTDNSDKCYTIKHTSGSHSVVVQGAETIDDAASQTLSEYGVLRIISDNSEWWTL